MGCLIEYIVYYMFKKSDQAYPQGGFVKKRLVHNHITFVLIQIVEASFLLQFPHDF